MLNNFCFGNFFNRKSPNLLFKMFAALFCPYRPYIEDLVGNYERFGQILLIIPKCLDEK